MEIKQRLNKANRAYYELMKLLRSRNLFRTIKTIIYKTLIRPIMIYGSEGWTLRAADAESLGRIKRKILRKIFGALKTGINEYRRKWNSELYQVYNDADVSSYIKVGRLRWLGHVNRMEDSMYVYLYWSPQGYNLSFTIILQTNKLLN